MYSPDLTVPFEEKKSKDFGLRFARGLEMMHLQQVALFNSPRRRWAENYQYALANQSVLRTIRPIENISGNDAFTLPGADLRNVHVAPSMVDAINGKMNKVQFKPNVTMIDALSMDKRDYMRNKLQFFMELQKAGAEIGPMLQQFGLTPEEIPLDTTELEIKVNMMPQFVEEMNLELGIEGVTNDSKIDVLSKMVDNDLIITSTGGYWIDRTGGKRVIKRLDPLNSGWSFSMVEDARDVVFAYTIEPVPITKVMYDAAGYLSEEEMKLIRGGRFDLMYNWLYTWSAFSEGSTPVYSSTYVDYALVMYFEFISVDDIYGTMDADGNFKVEFKKPENPETENDVQLNTKVQNIFGGKYICGTGQIYDYGVKETIRQPITTNPENVYRSNPAKAYGSFIIYQANMVQGQSKSVIDRAKKHLDIIQQTVEKIDVYTKEFLPWLTVIDKAALADFAMEEGEDAITQDDILTTALTKGLITVDSGMLRGIATSSGKSIVQIIANQGGSNLQLLFQMLTQHIAFLRDLIGIPNVELGASPDTEQGKFVTQSQLSGSDNVLRGLMFAKMQLFQNLWENIMFDLMMNGGNGIINNRVYNIREGNPQEHIPNLKCTPLPTERDWQELYAMANQALQAGTITLDQVAYLKLIDNLKQAWGYLSINQKRGQAQAQQAATQQIEMNAQVQQQSNQMAQQGKETIEKLRIQGEIVKEVTKALMTGNKANVDMAIIQPLMLMFATPEQIAQIQQMQQQQQQQVPVINQQQQMSPEEQAMMEQEQMQQQQMQQQEMSPEEQAMMEEQMMQEQAMQEEGMAPEEQVMMEQQQQEGGSPMTEEEMLLMMEAQQRQQE